MRRRFSPLAVAVLLCLWVTPTAWALSVAAHVALDAHHHGHSHDAEYAEALRAAAHGHHHEFEADSEHEHDARLNGQLPASTPPACDPELLQVLPRADQPSITARVADAARAGPSPLAFLTNCSWLL